VVSLLDVAERKLITSMPTGGERPIDIVISSDGTRIYVSHGRTNEVRVFEADTWKLLASIPVGPRAWWMARTPDGRFLYVTVGRANEVVVIDTETNQVTSHIKGGELPWGVASPRSTKPIPLHKRELDLAGLMEPPEFPQLNRERKPARIFADAAWHACF